MFTRKIRPISILLACSAICYNANATPTVAQLEQLHQAAAQTQEQCFREIYRDPNAYAACVRALANAPGALPIEQLGAWYFGFVGALSYMRVSQAGAAPLAAEFLPRIRTLQKRTGVNDAQLCASVPGNCEIRIGQTLAMEKAPATHPVQSLRPVCRAGVCRIEGQ